MENERIYQRMVEQINSKPSAEKEETHRKLTAIGFFKDVPGLYPQFGFLLDKQWKENYKILAKLFAEFGEECLPNCHTKSDNGTFIFEWCTR